MSCGKMSRLEALVLLNSAVSPAAACLKKMLERFADDPEEIFSLKPHVLTKEGALTPFLAQRILDAPRRFDAACEIREAQKRGIKIITFFDDAYPKNLKEVDDSPCLLYVKGDFLPADSHAVALVGSRQASHYGLSCAKEFAASLGRWGITVVSGMARGIDTEAHKGCLEAKGRTIAVLGSGLKRIYPPENKKLFEEIASRGAVVSQFPLDTPPLASNFPVRNRVISGLSLGVVVVEASFKSGALITAHAALEHGREVFAVPGKVTSATSAGANGLIKDGAHMVTAPEEILEVLHLPLTREVKKALKDSLPQSASSREGLSQREHLVVGCLDDEPMHIDEICAKTGVGAGELMGVLLGLELKKLLRRLPGNSFIKTG